MTAATPETTSELSLRAALSDLRSEADAVGAIEIGRAFEALDERLRSRRLLVAVIGEHNRGKSTLINSMMGEPWLPMGQNAPALPPVYVFGSARERVEIVYADGKAVESTRSELLTLSSEDAESVSYARVGVASSDLHGITLVDTPGLNDPDTARLAQTVYGLLPQCDLALLVLDSAQALGASEQELLEQQIATADLHRLVVILNRDDALEDEAQRVEVRDRVTRLLVEASGKKAEVLPYAARTALRARERKDTRLLARSGYPELRALLADCAEARTRIMHEAATRKAASLAATLIARLAEPVVTPAPVENGDTALRVQIETACRALESIRDDYRLQAGAFILALRNKLPEEAAESSIDDIRRFLPFYIQEHVATFVQEHDGDLRDKIATALRDAGVADMPTEPLITGTPAPGLHPYVEPDFLEDSVLLTTFMTVVGLVMKPIVAGAVMTIGPILRMLSRNMYEKNTKGALVQAAMAATMEAGQALESQVDAAFTELIERLRRSVPPELAATEPIVADDSERQAARDRIGALTKTLIDQTYHRDTRTT